MVGLMHWVPAEMMINCGPSKTICKRQKEWCYSPNSRHSGLKHNSFRFHTIYCILMWCLRKPQHYLTAHLYLLLNPFPTPYDTSSSFSMHLFTCFGSNTNPFCTLVFFWPIFQGVATHFLLFLFAYVRRISPANLLYASILAQTCS